MDILIKDNVFDNVDEIRQRGLNITDYRYEDHPFSTGWKGYRSSELDGDDIITQKIINIVGDAYNIASCPFRRVAYHVTDIPSCMEKQQYKGKQLFHDFKWHNDGNIPGTYAGAIYLHPNPPPNSGTSVLDSEKNEIIHIENVYNRLACWPSHAQHAIANVFGNGIETGRMTIIFFIHPPHEAFTM